MSDIPAFVRERAAEVHARCKPRRRWYRWFRWLRVCRYCGEQWPCRQRIWADEIKSGRWPARSWFGGSQ